MVSNKRFNQVDIFIYLLRILTIYTTQYDTFCCIKTVLTIYIHFKNNDISITQYI